MKNIFCVLAMSLLLIACSEETPVAPTAEQVVVRAYLYAGEPVADIQITSTLELGSEDEDAPPINDAKVTLVKNGVRYVLQPSAGDSGYYHYSGNDLRVEIGDVFDIEVEYFGKIAVGQTSVPLPPDSLTISGTTLVTAQSTFPPNFNQNSLELTWAKQTGGLYYVVLDNLESNPEALTLGGPFGNQAPRRIILPPTSRNDYRIAVFNLTHYGLHNAVVYRVNQEYVDLYESRQQDSRDLNEPLTNIKNGLGVFSAFSSRAVQFRATKG